MAPHIKISRRPGGEPNWDARVDIFGSALITTVFGEARENIKALLQSGMIILGLAACSCRSIKPR